MSRRQRKIIVDNTTNIIYTNIDSIANATVANKFGIFPSILAFTHGNAKKACSIVKGVKYTSGVAISTTTYLEQVTMRLALPSAGRGVIVQIATSKSSNKKQLDVVEVGRYEIAAGQTSVTLPVAKLFTSGDRLFFNIVQCGIGRAGTGKGLAIELKLYKEPKA